MIALRAFTVCILWAVFCAVVVAPATLHAQASPAPAASPTAHIRFWKTELPGFSSLRVTLKPTTGRHPAAREIGNGSPGYVFNNYADAPAGHGTLEVFSAKQTSPLVSLPVNLVPGALVTVLLSEPSEAGGSPRLEIIEDDTMITDAARAQLTVRSFVADLKDVHLTVGENLKAQFVSGDCFLQMRGLKPALYPLHTVGAGVNGEPFDWNIEVDLREHRHQTLLIYPDPYGRIRPRLIADGESKQESPDSKESQR